LPGSHEVTAIDKYRDVGTLPTDSTDPLLVRHQKHWRDIVLYGRNVASYKFALAKSLLEIGASVGELVSLEDLAVPYARSICEHIAQVDRQGTFAHSKFLDACRFFNAGRITEEELRESAVLLGFNNVIDAFHVVGEGDVDTRFFMDERRSSGGIRLTDAFFALQGSPTAIDLHSEAEARWRLVEESWEAKAKGQQVIVLYDAPRELLVPALLGKRRPLTEVRPALNGYQKGHCFYCFTPISVIQGSTIHSDVDHFIPHSMMSRGLGVDLDGPWNLVLACQNCNRGPAGKFAALPAGRYVERLHNRNEFLIASHHPLRETIMRVTGGIEPDRRRFLRRLTDTARSLSTHRTGWTARSEGRALF
jgi:5-methylcytosine-specific restriction endonuclease McrA